MKLSLFGSVILGLSKITSALWPDDHFQQGGGLLNFGVNHNNVNSRAQLELDNMKYEFCFPTVGDDCLDKAAKHFATYYGDSFSHSFFSNGGLRNNEEVLYKAIEHLHKYLDPLYQTHDVKKKAYVSLILAGFYSPFQSFHSPQLSSSRLWSMGGHTYESLIKIARSEIPTVVEQYSRSTYVQLSPHDIQHLIREAKSIISLPLPQKHIKQAAKEGDVISMLKRAARLIAKRQGQTKESEKLLKKAVEKDALLADMVDRIAKGKLLEDDIEKAIANHQRDDFAPLRRR